MQRKWWNVEVYTTSVHTHPLISSREPSHQLLCPGAPCPPLLDGLCVGLKELVRATTTKAFAACVSAGSVLDMSRSISPGHRWTKTHWKRIALAEHLCPPPTANSYVEFLTPRNDGIRRYGLWEGSHKGGALTNGIHVS